MRPRLISRRKFLLETGTGIAFAAAPLEQLLAASSDPLRTCGAADDGLLRLHHLTPNGGDLHFHLINMRRSGGKLRPDVASCDSFLIVQLPPQSLHEEFFVADLSDQKNPKEFPKEQLGATLAGPSFLVFKVWPHRTPGDGRRWSLPFTVDALLEWERSELFQLQVAPRAVAPTETFPWKALISAEQQEIDKVTVWKDEIKNIRHDLAYYDLLRRRVMVDGCDLRFTILELPAGILMAPVDPVLPKKTLGQVAWIPTQNRVPNAENQVSIVRRTYRLSGAKEKVRTVTERWGVDLTTETRATTQDGARIDLRPALRALGLIDRLPPHQGKEHVDPHLDPDVLSARYLPLQLDERELAYLTQLGDPALSDDSRDISVDDSLRLTDLGGSLHLSYRNYDPHKDDLSLVEYEHHFQDGRDNFIKVARIGVCFPSGLKALHVSIAKRRYINGTSFVDYKEHIEAYEKKKEYGSDPGPLPSGSDKIRYEPFKPPENRTGQTASLGTPFKSVEILVDRTPSIQPARFQLFQTPPGRDGPDVGNSDTPGDDTYLNPLSFWAYREGAFHANQDGKSAAFANLILTQHRFTDRAGVVHDTVRIPILFMRREFFATTNSPLAGRWQTAVAPHQSLKKWDDERLRIPMAGHEVGYTQDDPVPSVQSDPNTLNRLQTDWIEQYFSLARTTGAASENLFETARHVIYPQMRRAKVYIDHLQQLGSGKAPSVVSYAQYYLDHALSNTENKAKVILGHAEGFLLDKLKDLSDNPLGVLDPDLVGAGARVKGVFANAGAKLGGLMNPDPALRWISLGESALSLPDKAESELQNIAADGGRIVSGDLFANAGAELFCGIPLKAILQTLGVADAPQYLLRRLPDPLLDPKAAAASLGDNPVVRQALDAISEVKNDIKKVQGEIESIRSQIVEAKEGLRKTATDLAAEMPSEAAVLALARQQCEAGLLDGFDRLKGPVTDDVKHLVAVQVAQFYDAQLQAMDFAVDGFLTSDLATAITNVLTPNLSDRTTSDIKALQAHLRNLKGWHDTFAPLLARRPTPDWVGLAALLGDAFNTLPLTQALDFDQDLTALRQVYELSIPASMDAKVRAMWEAKLLALEVERRTLLLYHQRRLDEINKDVDSMVRTLPVAVTDVIGRLSQAYTDARVFQDQVRREWTQSGADKAIELWKNRGDLSCKLIATAKSALTEIASNDPRVKQLLQERDAANQKILGLEDQLRKSEVKLGQDIKTAGEGFAKQFEAAFAERVAGIVDAGQIAAAWDAYQALNRVLGALQHQTLTTQWTTTSFQPADLSIVAFLPSNSPQTRLTLSSSVDAYFDPLHVPPVLKRTEVHVQTALTDFSVVFLRVLQVDFDRLQFLSGTGVSTQVDVRVRRVRFTGALSFIQKLQDLLGGLGDGMQLDIGSDRVTIGYLSPALSISSPGFTFANFAFGVAVEISFKREPLKVRFNLATAEKKATIAAGIYGGAFFCALEVDAKHGLIGIEMAMEMGAYLGISFGPFSGHVSFMVGLYYRKDQTGVVLEGYFVAEGTLSVWIVSVSARLYMGVKSQNSSVTGFCIATYSVKVGLIEKDFSASFQRTIAGAAENSGGESGSGQNSLLTEDTIAAGALATQRAALYQLAVEAAQDGVFEEDPDPISRGDLMEFQSKYFAFTREN